MFGAIIKGAALIRRSTVTPARQLREKIMELTKRRELAGSLR